MFVEMYGIPDYDGIDPVPIVALTYSLLFGIMFGDVGQGIVVILAGLLLSKWKGMKLGEVMMRIGIFSTMSLVPYSETRPCSTRSITLCWELTEGRSTSCPATSFSCC